MSYPANEHAGLMAALRLGRPPTVPEKLMGTNEGWLGKLSTAESKGLLALRKDALAVRCLPDERQTCRACSARQIIRWRSPSGRA